MKKRKVITTEKHEVWVIRHASEVPAAFAEAAETESWKSDSSNESLRTFPELPDKDVPPTHED